MMKTKYFLIFAATIFFSCGSRKGYLDRNDADRALQDAVKKIKKSPDDEDARAAIPQLYKLIKQKHLDQIKAYAATTQLSKWDNLIEEYQDLQHAYDVIINSTEAYKLVTPDSYSTNILQCKDSAANAYYTNGVHFLSFDGRENAKKAYSNFERARAYDPDYKDVNEKMRVAFEKAVVNVVVFPVDERLVQTGFGGIGKNTSNEYFEQNLISDLSGTDRYAARFYNKNNANSMNINPNWVISFKMRALNVSPPVNSYSERKSSAPIKIGTDSSGAPVYNNVYATIFITHSELSATGDLEMTITDMKNQNILSAKVYHEDYKWSQESATFNGDRRALSQSDLNLLTNAQLSAPTKEQVITALYKQLYPKMLNHVKAVLNW